MAMPDMDGFRFANEAGTEAFQVILKRTEALGERSFAEITSAVTGAAVICLANALRPAIESGQTPESRAALADALTASSMKQVRAIIDPLVRGDP